MEETLHDITPTEARRRIAAGALLIDVRERDEWDDGHVAEARHLPLAELPDCMGTLPKECELIVLCHSGKRSARARAFLATQGYDRVYNLDGGMLAWVRDGLPVIT
ncbi:rhodanese-like domain-containing protein [bacterium]|nr:MAG: rhodanese-like domain-containing protein [bacterium]